MRHTTVSLGENAQLPFTVVLGDTVVAATAAPVVSEVFVNGAYDAAQTGAATVTQFPLMATSASALLTQQLRLARLGSYSG